MKSYPRAKLSQLKQLKISKATSNLNEKVKMILEAVLLIKIPESKFQREQRTRIVFQKQKRKAKVPNF